MVDITATRSRHAFADAPLYRAGAPMGGVVRSDPPRRPNRAFVFWSGPWFGPGSRRWTFAVGVRYDLAKPFEHPPSRLRLEVTRQRPMTNNVPRTVAGAIRIVPVRIAGGWSVRLSSDFVEIERRIQYRAVARWLVHKLVGPNPSKWDYWREEARLESVAWNAGDVRIAVTALRGVEAIRGVMAESGITDRHGRMHRTGFFR